MASGYIKDLVRDGFIGKFRSIFGVSARLAKSGFIEIAARIFVDKKATLRDVAKSGNMSFHQPKSLCASAFFARENKWHKYCSYSGIHI
jgi:hypothetical protein